MVIYSDLGADKQLNDLAATDIVYQCRKLDLYYGER